MMEKISVAIATYNGEKYLREQLESLYSQTRLPDEVVVSDDCSTDNTLSILSEYEKKYGLKILQSQVGLGVNKNFEKAISNCTGDYIAICDQDDIWFPQKIEILLNKIKEIENGKPAVVSSQVCDVDHNGKIIQNQTLKRMDTWRCVDTILSPPGVTQGCTMMLNKRLKDLLGGFPPFEVCLYDCYIGFLGASVGIKYNISAPLMYYRHHQTNVLARIQGKRNLKQLIKSAVADVSHIHIIPPKRFIELGYIYQRHGNLFDDKIKTLYMQVDNLLKSKGIFRKVRIILKLRELTLTDKISLLISVMM